MFLSKYEPALKIPNTFSSPNSQSNEINGEREDQVIDNITGIRQVRKKYSEASALSFSTSSTDSFSSILTPEIVNYWQIFNPKSIDFQLSEKNRSLSLDGILQSDEANLSDSTYFLDSYEDNDGKKNRLIF